MNCDAGCETCAYLVPIGEGDHICDNCDDPSGVVLVEYGPGPDYMCCEGKRYKPAA